MRKVKFDVQGMTCSSCSSHVERDVKKLSGIKSVNVNLLSNNMQVEYDENVLDDEKIINTVIEAGYGANVHEDIRKIYNGKKQEDPKDNIKSMKNRLIISICFLIPLMYIAMHHMIYDWIKIPVPQIIKNLFDRNTKCTKFCIYTVFTITSNNICK